MSLNNNSSVLNPVQHTESSGSGSGQLLMVVSSAGGRS